MLPTDERQNEGELLDISCIEHVEWLETRSQKVVLMSKIPAHEFNRNKERFPAHSCRPSFS